MNLSKIKLTLLAGLMLLLSSCHGDLDITQNDRLSANNMWQDEGDVEAATYGTYSYLREAFKTNIIYWGEYRNGLWGPGTHGTLQNNHQADVAASTMNASNDYTGWKALYTTINEANLIIKHAPKMEITEASRKFSLSNAYFVRALSYFWVARIWGDVPLPLEGFESMAQEVYLERVSVSEVLQRVEGDILSAEENLPDNLNKKNILTPAALAMLKADFALWMYTTQNGGDKYLKMASSAIQSMNLSPAKLETEFANIFKSNSKLGAEVIFALHQEHGQSVNGFPYQQAWNQDYIDKQYKDNPVPVGGGNQWWLYTNTYIKLLTEDISDKRIPTTYGHGEYGVGGKEIGWPNKFMGQVISGTRVFDSDILLYRYAQAYLFDAEIKYYQKDYKGALASVNVVANRAYGNPNYYTDATPDAVLGVIIKENLKEFASEGNTWWTLLRTDAVWDYNANLARQKNKKNILLWPVSASALKSNYKLRQTEGWL